jgi:hypothetical protein
MRKKGGLSRKILFLLRILALLSKHLNGLYNASTEPDSGAS